MHVLVMASQKGGAGKTTLTGHLAVAASGIGPVVVIDTDPQGSLTSWWNRRGSDTPAISRPPRLRDLGDVLDGLRKAGMALAIIDTPPAITASIREVIRVADLVVIPVRPSPHDLDAIGATIDLANEAGAPFVFAVTQAKLQARVTAQAAALLSAHGTVASSIIQDRVLYATAMTDGRTALDTDPKGAAAQEITQLWQFLLGRLQESTTGAKERRKKVA